MEMSCHTLCKLFLLVFLAIPGKLARRRGNFHTIYEMKLNWWADLDYVDKAGILSDMPVMDGCRRNLTIKITYDISTEYSIVIPMKNLKCVSYFSFKNPLTKSFANPIYIKKREGSGTSVEMTMTQVWNSESTKFHSFAFLEDVIKDQFVTLEWKIRRPRIVVSVTLKEICSLYQYGRKCGRECQPQNDDDNGHYDCTSSGKKTCFGGYTGRNCKQIDPCHIHPCQNNGVCLSELHKDSYTCQCNGEFKGPNCTIPKQACERKNICNGNGICTDLRNGTDFKCNCNAGWMGKHCGLNQTRCNSLMCENGHCQKYIDGYDSVKYKCNCTNTGYTGDQCKNDVNECLEQPCQNNGTCINQIGSFLCKCKYPSFGRYCEKCEGYIIMKQCVEDIFGGKLLSGKSKNTLMIALVSSLSVISLALPVIVITAWKLYTRKVTRRRSFAK